MTISGVIGKAQIAKKAVKNPFDFLVDTAITWIVRYLVPVPFAGELAVYFKGPLLAMCGMVLVIGIVVIVTSIGLIFAPVSVLQSLTGSLTSTLTGTGAGTIPIDALKGYLEPGFSDTDIPTIDPFGRNGQIMSILTAGFHDQDYYNNFGIVHEGIDLVPSQSYYATNKAYAKTHAVIMFATTSGKTRIYTDSYGALTVDVTNSPGTLKTVYKHLNQIIVDNNASIHAGTPIGVMGKTGFATADHLHYEVRLNQGGRWVAVNPQSYIN